MSGSRVDLAVAGGGLAAARVVQGYREAGGEGTIALVGREPHPPYHRPPLTKRLLRGEQKPAEALVAGPETYRELEVEMRLGTRVEALDAGRRELSVAGGDTLRFDRLVIATGALPRRLAVDGAGLPGVHTLRTIDDSLAIRDAAQSVERAVVVGTSFIGLESSASLRTLGVGVTLVDVAEAPFASFEAPAFSSFLVDRYRAEGVELLLGEDVSRFEGNGRLEALVTSSGARVEAGLAVVGIGVAPATAWLEGSGVELDDGVVVDERFRTSVEGIYAVGDVARFHDPVFGRRRRIEHWSNADYQGRTLGRILAGEDLGYDHVSAFFTELFGTVYRLLGDPEGAAETELEGDFAAGEAVLRYLDGDGRLQAALVTGVEEERRELLEAEIRKISSRRR